LRRCCFPCGKAPALIARKPRLAFYWGGAIEELDEFRAHVGKIERFATNGDKPRWSFPAMELRLDCNDFDRRHCMNPARSQDMIRHSAAHIRRLALAMCAAVILCGVGGASHAAPANDNTAQPPLPPALEQRFEAPIGHAQPTAEDVPASVLRDEGAATRNQRDLDKKLDICRGC
jgi:hypothetical protein